MFDFSFSELLLIAVAAIVFVGPKDLPVVVRHVAKALHELRALYLGLKAQAAQLVEETGLHEIEREVTTIIDMDGKPQKAYDVTQLDALKDKPKADA